MRKVENDVREATRVAGQCNSVKKPYRAPAIAEEEVFESYALQCGHTPTTGTPACNSSPNS